MYNAEENRENEAEREGKENGEEDRRWGRTARGKSDDARGRIVYSTMINKI